MALTEKDIKRGEKALKVLEKFIATKEGDDILIGGRTIVAEAVALLKHRLTEAATVTKGKTANVETAAVPASKKRTKKPLAGNLPSLDDEDEDEDAEEAPVDSSPKVSL